MLSGVKFIPRDQIDKGKYGNGDDDAIVEKRKSSGGGKRERSRRKKKGSSYTGSSDDDIERIKTSSRRKKKWYSSDEHSSEASSDGDSGSDGSSGQEERRRKGRRKRKSRDPDRRRYSSEDNSSSASGERKKSKDRVRKKDMGDNLSDDGRGAHSRMRNVDITRKELGLDWMLRPAEKINNRMPAATVDSQPEDPPAEEIEKANPRELNPYLNDGGTGYPDDSNEKRVGGDQLPSSAVVGDGGASWRLKALKRAREQAAREGRKLDEVAEERWGSLGQLAVSAASHVAAPSRAHLHAIRDRKRGLNEDCQTTSGSQSERNIGKHACRDYLKDVSAQHPQMRAPKVHESLSWGKRKSQSISNEDVGLISAVASSINKFADDGSFISKFVGQQIDKLGDSVGSLTSQEAVESKMASSEKGSPFGGSAVDKGTLSANQLAAKALQLRMKGRHEEAEKLMQEAESMKAHQGHGENLCKPQKLGSSSRYVIPPVSGRREDDDADRQLAQKIVTNKQYSLSGQADDEYDFEDGPRRKSQKKAQIDHKTFRKNNLAKRILTQQERCSFCFENPNRPKHLVVSIANFTYLMLPQWQPVVPGHCCILPMQHESATRSVDNDVWEEIRNFKKCLIMMFAKQEKDVLFLETVMGLAQQRRHCLIECIPLPSETASSAPMYFKKAIDEAEEEWSQHNAKKLIDTSVKGLRGSIPKDFPYFHVEFGLNKGFVHVIDDEKQFKANFGLNVIRGMLEQQPEHMYGPPKYESVGAQKQAVADFAQDWGPFDWTKQLEY